MRSACHSRTASPSRTGSGRAWAAEPARGRSRGRDRSEAREEGRGRARGRGCRPQDRLAGKDLPAKSATTTKPGQRRERHCREEQITRVPDLGDGHEQRRRSRGEGPGAARPRVRAPSEGGGEPDEGEHDEGEGPVAQTGTPPGPGSRPRCPRCRFSVAQSSAPASSSVLRRNRHGGRATRAAARVGGGQRDQPALAVALREGPRRRRHREARAPTSSTGRQGEGRGRDGARARNRGCSARGDRQEQRQGRERGRTHR